jgi:hypothetical protein
VRFGYFELSEFDSFVQMPVRQGILGLRVFVSEQTVSINRYNFAVWERPGVQWLAAEMRDGGKQRLL